MTTQTVGRMWLGPGQLGLRLAPSVHAPVVARRFVRAVCGTCPLPVRIVDDAVLVAGELVAASVREVHSPVDVAVLAGADVITLRLRDAATAAPDAAGTGVVARRSWGMVHRLSTAWGYRGTADGRVLWASFRAFDLARIRSTH